MESRLEGLLACPRDQSALHRKGETLVCGQGHSYPVYDGIPVMLLDDVEQTAWWCKTSLHKARDRKSTTENEQLPKEGIDPHVQAIVASTSGYLYKPLVNRLKTYPIPEIRLPNSEGELLLDVGCNWGRWSVAAATRGYRVVGIDPALDAVLAARRVAAQLKADCKFVVGDARFLPFKPAQFGVVFSYSVIQHFSKENARSALRSISKVLKADGKCLVQMPNRNGIRSLYHLAKRGFSEGKEFDVRYYTVRELERLFTSVFGNASSTVDGYFGLGIQPADINLLPKRYRAVVCGSETLRRASVRLPWMRYMADSIYLESRKVGSRGPSDV